MKGVVVINAFTAAWLMFTAWSVPGGVDAGRLTRNDATMGLVLIVLVGWALVSHAQRPLALWLQMLVGGWLIVAPLALRYNPWSDLPSGLITIAVATLALPFAALESHA